MRRFAQKREDDEGQDPLGWPMLWPGGRHIACNGLGRIFLWDLKTGECVKVLRSAAICRDGYPVFQLATEPQLGRILDGHGVRQFAVYDEHDWRCLQVFHGHGEEVHAASFVAEDRIVSVSGDSTACLWDAWSGKQLRSLDTHPLYALAQHPRDARLAVAGGSGQVAILEGPALRLQTSFKLPQQKAKHAPMSEARKRQLGIVWNRPSSTIQAIAWHPDGERLVCGSWDFVPKLIDARSGRIVRTFLGHAHWVDSLALDASGQRLITGSSDGTVRVFSIDSAECLAVFDLDHSSVGGMLVHEGQIFVTCKQELLAIPLPT